MATILVTILESVRPICLPSFRPPVISESTELFASGWGATENGENVRNLSINTF